MIVGKRNHTRQFHSRSRFGDEGGGAVSASIVEVGTWDRGTYRSEEVQEPDAALLGVLEAAAGREDRWAAIRFESTPHS